MLVYLVEDDSLKADVLIEFLKEKLPTGEVSCFGSFQSGLRAIQKESPHLILLDMTLPTFDRGSSQSEGRLRPLGGYDIMRKLKLKNIPFRAIVVTQLETFGEDDNRVTYEEITDRCQKEFSGQFFGSVHFPQGSDDWKDDLGRLIDALTVGV